MVKKSSKNLSDKADNDLKEMPKSDSAIFNKGSDILLDERKQIYSIIISDLVLAMTGFYKLANNHNKTELLTILKNCYLAILGP